MKSIIFTSFLFLSTICLSQNDVGVEQQNVYNSSDGRTANWYAVNNTDKGVNLEIKVTLTGCDAKTISEIKKIYVGKRSKSYIGFNKSTCFGKNKGFRYRSVSVISKKFN
ncbi:hypothetical protein [Aquimarina celericrescens]|uniref:Uncharacterized protein n=1 Tax=Aquimarina celericrescens TaxID=1964542 RepID=A0ABW5AXP6_9FLAO|nr:hypothetical protein [Aquimarina celericrescens]